MISMLFPLKVITSSREDNKVVSISLMIERIKSYKNLKKRHQFIAFSSIQIQTILQWENNIFQFTILTRF